MYASLFRQKQAVKKRTNKQKKTKINTQQERSTQYKQRHYAYIWQWGMI